MADLMILRASGMNVDALTADEQAALRLLDDAEVESLARSQPTDERSLVW